MILGLIDTRSVFVPTSAEYFSLIGGMLHLRTASENSPNGSESLDSTFELKYLNTKSAESISFPHLLFLMMPPFPTTAHFLNWDLEYGMSWCRRQGDGHKNSSFEGNRQRFRNNRADKLTSGNILKISAVIGRMPLVSTSYRSLVPTGVFLLVVNRKDGALQHRDRDILQADGEEDGDNRTIRNGSVSLE